MNCLIRLAEWAMDERSRLQNGLAPTKCPVALETELTATMAIMDSLTRSD
jgi:hypothetical protein